MNYQKKNIYKDVVGRVLSVKERVKGDVGYCHIKCKRKVTRKKEKVKSYYIKHEPEKKI